MKRRFNEQSRAKQFHIDSILDVKLTKLRIELSTLVDRKNSEFDEDSLESFVAKIASSSANSKMVLEEYENVKQVMATGDLNVIPNLNKPETQLLWGAALVHMEKNMEAYSVLWDNTPADAAPHVVNANKIKDLAGAPFWEKLIGAPAAVGELTNHARFLSEEMRRTDVKFAYGIPGTGFKYTPKDNQINVDLMSALVAGFEHTRSLLFREIGHSFISRQYPDRSNEIREEIKKIKGEYDTATGTKNFMGKKVNVNMPPEDYIKLRLLTAEWQMRNMLWTMAEHNVWNRYASDKGERLSQDYSYSLNHDLLTVGGYGQTSLRTQHLKRVIENSPLKILRDNVDVILSHLAELFGKNEDEAGKTPLEEYREKARKRFINTIRSVEMGFYRGNDLFEDTPTGWLSVGVDPKLVTMNSYPRHFDEYRDGVTQKPGLNGFPTAEFNYLMDLCAGDDGLEKMQPGPADKLFGYKYYKKRAEELSAQRNKIIEKIWDYYLKEDAEVLLQELEDSLRQDLGLEALDREIKEPPSTPPQNSAKQQQQNAQNQPQNQPQQQDPAQQDPQAGTPQESQAGDPEDADPQSGSSEAGSTEDNKPQEADPQQSESSVREAEQGDTEQSESQKSEASSDEQNSEQGREQADLKSEFNEESNSSRDPRPDETQQSAPEDSAEQNSQAQDSDPQDSQAQDSDPQDSQAQDSQAQDSQAQDSQAQDSDPQDGADQSSSDPSKSEQSKSEQSQSEQSQSEQSQSEQSQSEKARSEQSDDEKSQSENNSSDDMSRDPSQSQQDDGRSDSDESEANPESSQSESSQQDQKSSTAEPQQDDQGKQDSNKPDQSKQESGQEGSRQQDNANQDNANQEPEAEQLQEIMDQIKDAVDDKGKNDQDKMKQEVSDTPDHDQDNQQQDGLDQDSLDQDNSKQGDSEPRSEQDQLQEMMDRLKDAMQDQDKRDQDKLNQEMSDALDSDPEDNQSEDQNNQEKSAQDTMQDMMDQLKEALDDQDARDQDKMNQELSDSPDSDAQDSQSQDSQQEDNSEQQNGEPQKSEKEQLEELMEQLKEAMDEQSQRDQDKMNQDMNDSQDSDAQDSQQQDSQQQDGQQDNASQDNQQQDGSENGEQQKSEQEQMQDLMDKIKEALEEQNKRDQDKMNQDMNDSQDSEAQDSQSQDSQQQDSQSQDGQQQDGGEQDMQDAMDKLKEAMEGMDQDQLSEMFNDLQDAQDSQDGDPQQSQESSFNPGEAGLSENQELSVGEENGQGQKMPNVDLPPDAPEVMQDPSAQEDGPVQDLQDSQGQQPGEGAPQGMTLEQLEAMMKAMQQAQQGGDQPGQGMQPIPAQQPGQQPGQGEAPDGMPSDQAGDQSGKSLDEIARMDWNNFPAIVRELQGHIHQVARLLRKIREQQVQKEIRRSADLELFPEGKELDRLDMEAHRELIKKMKSGQPIEERDLHRFQKNEEFDDPTIIDLVLLIDGSGSMDTGSHNQNRTTATPMEIALLTATIIYEAAQVAGVEAKAHIAIWGDDNPIVIAEPGDDPHKVSERISKFRKGTGSGTKLEPSLKSLAEIKAEEKPKGQTKTGFTHVVIISDGDIGDPEPAQKAVETILDSSDHVTIDAAIIKGASYSTDKLREMFGKIESKYPAQKISSVDGLQPNELPAAVIGKIFEKLQRCESFIAIPFNKKKKQFKRAQRRLEP